MNPEKEHVEENPLIESFSFLEESSPELVPKASKARMSRAKKSVWPARVLFWSLHAVLGSLVLMGAGVISTPGFLLHLKERVHEATRDPKKPVVENHVAPLLKSDPNGTTWPPGGGLRRPNQSPINQPSAPREPVVVIHEEPDSPVIKPQGEEKTTVQTKLSGQRGVPTRAANPPAAPARPGTADRIETLRARIADLETQHEQNKQREKEKMLRDFERVKRVVKVEGKNLVNAGMMGAGERVDLFQTLENERIAFANNQDSLPGSKIMLASLIKYQLNLHGSRRPLIMNYERLLLMLPEADRLAECAEPRNRQKQHDLEAAEVVKFKPGSVWAGTRFAAGISSKGEFIEGEVPFELRVNEIQGDRFEGIAIFADKVASAKVQGVFDGFRVQWVTGDEIKADVAARKWKAEGVILGSRLLGHLEGRNVNKNDGVIVDFESIMRLERRN